VVKARAYNEKIIGSFELAAAPSNMYLFLVEIALNMLVILQKLMSAIG